MLLDFSRYRSENVSQMQYFNISPSLCWCTLWCDHLLYPNDQLSTSHTYSIYSNYKLQYALITIFHIDHRFGLRSSRFFGHFRKRHWLLVALWFILSLLHHLCGLFVAKAIIQWLQKTRVDAWIISVFTCFCCCLQKKKVTIIMNMLIRKETNDIS